MIEPVEQFNRRFLQAVSQEQLIRDCGFLGINGRIGPHEVKPLTLYHYTALRVACSPFLPPFFDPSPNDLSQLLWLLNPHFSPDNFAGKKRFMRHCRYFYVPAFPLFKTAAQMKKWKARARQSIQIFGDLYRKAREYMEEELQDQPQASSSNSFQAAYYSDAASIVGTLVREYGWSMEFISRLPLKFVFQLLKEIADYHSACAGRSAILFNPSDRIKHERLQQLNSAIKKN